MRVDQGHLAPDLHRAQLARPGRIFVEDFGATPERRPAQFRLGAEATGAEPQTPEDVELGRKLGAAIARQLTLDLQDMGLPAVRRWARPRHNPTTS